jgi:hypothetical protein
VLAFPVRVGGSSMRASVVGASVGFPHKGAQVYAPLRGFRDYCSMRAIYCGWGRTAWTSLRTFVVLYPAVRSLRSLLPGYQQICPSRGNGHAGQCFF